MTLISNGDKRIYSTDLLETYPYGTKKHLICKKRKTKFNNKKTMQK